MSPSAAIASSHSSARLHAVQVELTQHAEIDGR